MMIEECNGKLFNEEEILRHEHTVSMIVELNRGIPGFTGDEIQDILNFISTI